MNKIKKIILTMLIFTIFLTSANLYNFNSVEATTKGYTPDTAINFVKSLINKQIDVDGAYPGECVDLIMAYERELSGVYYSRKWKRLCT